MTALDPIPLALYVHFPWCVSKCPYCDFNSHALRGELPEQAYVDALLADLEQDLALAAGRRVVSVFLGGGTPSLFGAAALERLLVGLRPLLDPRPGLEITLEANPGTVEQGRFADYRALGINRLSLGIQSFDDDALTRLGRAHDASQAHAAVRNARAAGFDNLNLDLMHGLPGQTRSGAREDVAKACAVGAEHLSYYQLTLEPNTWFHRHPPALPDADTVWAIEQDGHERLAAAGYERYEVSAFARPGRRSAHNLNYWRFGDYLGIGAGAHGKLTTGDPPVVRRASKQRQPRAYLREACGSGRLLGERRLGPDDLVAEFMLNALRLREGFEPALFTRRTGLALERIAPTLARLVADGLLESDAGRVRASERGYRFLNDVVGAFC